MPNLGQHLLPPGAVGTVVCRAARAGPSEPAPRRGGPLSAGKHAVCVMCVCGSAGSGRCPCAPSGCVSPTSPGTHSLASAAAEADGDGGEGCRLVSCWPGLVLPHTALSGPAAAAPEHCCPHCPHRQVRRQTAQAGTAARQGAKPLLRPRTDAAQKQSVAVCVAVGAVTVELQSQGLWLPGTGL